MSTGESGQQPTEEELRAAYEEELRKIRVEHVLLEQVVTLINLGMRRTGMAPGTEGERDPEQVRLAVEAVRTLLPLVEQVAQPQVAPIRDALSQLQMAYVRLGGQPPSADTEDAPAPAGGEAPPGAQPRPPASEPPAPAGGQEGQAGPAQRSGRLWIPGQ